MEKRRSVISKITLNTATFTNEPVEPTYINLFFGRNGAGKSSIAYAIQAGEGLEWKPGEKADDYDVLVYNQDFIDDNFESYDNLQGGVYRQPGEYRDSEADRRAWHGKDSGC